MIALPSSQIGWRRRQKTLAPGRKARTSICGRFRVLTATMIAGVVIDRDRRGNPRRFYHAEQRIERPAGNIRWELLSTHRTEAAARAACQKAARPSRPLHRPQHRG